MTTYVKYACGCVAGGDLISMYCPIHTNEGIIREWEE